MWIYGCLWKTHISYHAEFHIAYRPSRHFVLCYIKHEKKNEKKSVLFEILSRTLLKKSAALKYNQHV